MKSLLAFMKKETAAQLRSGKLIILGSIFLLLGIMNPATAKLTPWLLKIMEETLAETGMTLTAATASAMDSWMQFFKNMPLGLIAFVLLESSIFTKEYRSGTLVLSLTKGLDRFKVVISKAAVLAVLWTASYWLCFGITYACNAYFWDNSVAQNLALSAAFWWLFGVWVVSLMILFSMVMRSNTGVLLGCGGVILLSYLLGLLPKAGKYFPTLLADGTSLIYGVSEPNSYIVALIVTAVLTVISFAVSFPVFNKKQL